MSQVFFEELNIPSPDVILNVGSGHHGWQTAQMLMGIEDILLVERPDWVLVYGDTNSTLAGALAAVKLHIPLAHVEAGLRSFNRAMPEEHNRVLVDHCADKLFCPTQTAVDNLSKEGISGAVHLVGDTMYDGVLYFLELARKRSKVLADLGLRPKSYLLVTIHRPSNADVAENLNSILSALVEIGETAILPLHPRTRAMLDNSEVLFTDSSNIRVIDPQGYLDMLVLEQNARMILTDSGGIQKEAYWLGVPCVTLREETEWVETVQAGWNILVGASTAQIVKAVRSFEPSSERPSLYGNGQAAERIVERLERT